MKYIAVPMKLNDAVAVESFDWKCVWLYPKSKTEVNDIHAFGGKYMIV